MSGHDHSDCEQIFEGLLRLLKEATEEIGRLKPLVDSHEDDARAARDQITHLMEETFLLEGELADAHSRLSTLEDPE